MSKVIIDFPSDKVVGSTAAPLSSISRGQDKVRILFRTGRVCESIHSGGTISAGKSDATQLGCIAHNEPAWNTELRIHWNISLQIDWGLFQTCGLICIETLLYHGDSEVAPRLVAFNTKVGIIKGFRLPCLVQRAVSYWNTGAECRIVDIPTKGSLVVLCAGFQDV